MTRQLTGTGQIDSLRVLDPDAQVIHTQASGSLLRHFSRRLRRRPRPGSRQSSWHRWNGAAPSGCWPHARFGGCLAMRVAPLASTTTLRRAVSVILALGSWDRNMFGPVRGPWPDDSWKGWWGDNPPYHTPVFVLTNHKRASITMEGGTTFHFVTDGIEAALRQASEAAKGLDVRLGGGVADHLANTFAHAWSTKSTWRSHLASSAQANIFWPASTCRHSAIGAPSIFPRRTPPTSS